MVYLDNASTQRPNVMAAAKFYDIALDEKNWMNPSNTYNSAPYAMITEAKKKIAQYIHCEPSEIVFTSGASEGNATACNTADNVFYSPYEHHNYYLNPRGISITDEEVLSGHIKSWKPDRYAHMLVSNLTGEIFNVNPLFNLVHETEGLTICDCTQALGKIPLSMKNIDCDVAIFTGHKIGAPRGIGFMYIKDSVKDRINPVIFGTQEDGRRGGTYNTAGILSLAECVDLECKRCLEEDFSSKYTELKRLIRKELLVSLDNYDKTVYDIEIENINKKFIPTTLTFFLPRIESDVLQAMLAEKNIYIGVGSGCNDGSMKIDPAIEPYNVPEEFVRGMIRLSFSPENVTHKNDVILAIKELCKMYQEIIK